MKSIDTKSMIIGFLGCLCLFLMMGLSSMYPKDAEFESISLKNDEGDEVYISSLGITIKGASDTTSNKMQLMHDGLSITKDGLLSAYLNTASKSGGGQLVINDWKNDKSVELFTNQSGNGSIWVYGPYRNHNHFAKSSNYY